VQCKVPLLDNVCGISYVEFRNRALRVFLRQLSYLLPNTLSMLTKYLRLINRSFIETTQVFRRFDRQQFGIDELLKL